MEPLIVLVYSLGMSQMIRTLARIRPSRRLDGSDWLVVAAAASLWPLFLPIIEVQVLVHDNARSPTHSERTK